MKKKKIRIILLILLFIFVPLLLIPSNNAAITNIWGISEGSEKIYSGKITYSGSIEDVADYGDFTYKIINIWDSNANNYTELMYSRKLVYLGNPIIGLFTHGDSVPTQGGSWDYNVLLTPLDDNDIYPIVPTGCNSILGIGLNWTTEIAAINALANYSATLSGNVLTIYHWSEGIDGDTASPFTEDEYIKWDRSTGWLISYKRTKVLGDPANYVEEATIVIAAESEEAVFDITLIFGIVGAVCGGFAIGIAALTWRKLKQGNSEKHSTN